MATLAHLFGLVLLLTVCVAALASLVFGFPGTVVIVLAALAYAWATGFTSVGWSTVAWLAGLAVLGEGLELISSAVATAGTRPSRRVSVATIVGSFAGGILGTPFLFGLGALLGALIGAFAGAALAVVSAGATTAAAVSTGLAALRGRLIGFVLKAAVAVIMVGILFFAAV